MPKVIDLFCGCGGLSEGFKLAGYTIVGGVDFNSAAIETYSANFPGAKGREEPMKRLSLLLLT